jgi:universal stress protein E
MAPFTHVLASVDLSERSGHTAFQADRIARSSGAALTLLHVESGLSDPASASADRAALLAALAELADELQRAKSPRLVLEEGPVAEQVLAYATAHAVDLIVVGRHRRSLLERLFLESVGEHVSAGASCSVLAVEDPAVEARRAPSDPSEIVCAVDLQPWSASTVQVASALAEAQKARLTLVYVLESPAQGTVARAYEALSDLVARQPRPLANVDTRVGLGRAAEEIVRIASAQRASLVVVGARATESLRQGIPGSVARRLLQQAPCSVLFARASPQPELKELQASRSARADDPPLLSPWPCVAVETW